MLGPLRKTLSTKRYGFRGTVVFVLAFGALGLAGWLTELYVHAEADRQSTLRAQQTQIASSALRSTLESELNASLHLSTGMFAYVRARNGELSEEGVQSFLGELTSQRANVRNMAVAPGNRVRYIYPIQGNEAALGLYYPDIPAQWPAVEYVMRERKPLLVGPINLVQGGQGFIYRVPIFLDENTYWGLISSVIDAVSIYQTLDQTAALYGVRYQLETPQQPATDIHLHPEALQTPISLLGATWTIYVAPGAQHDALVGVRFTRALGWGVGILIALVLLFGTMAYERERKLALQQAENDAQLRKLSGQLPGVLYMFERSNEAKYAFTYVSATGETLLGGVPISSLKNFDVLLEKYVAEPERNAYITSIERSAKELTVWNYTFCVPMANGEVKFIEAISQPECREDGTVRWYGFAMDVTERTLAQQKIEVQEARHHAILKALPDLLVTFDASGEVTQVEAGHTLPEELAGGLVVGKPFTALFPPESHEGCKGVMERVWATGKGESAVLCGSSGLQARWFELRLEPIQDQKGHVLAILRDITEAREAQEQLLRLNQRLELSRLEAQDLAQKAEAASRAKSAFLAMMSHEIRTPMNGILGMTELLRDSGLSEDQRSYADIVHESSEALLDLLNNVLEISAIEVGTAVVRVEETNIRKLTADVLSLFYAQAREKGIGLKLEVTDEVPESYPTDPARLRQILLNLVSNAIKFTEQGDVKLSVRMGSELQSPYLEVAVQDTGIGIAEEHQEALFKPFSQVDSSLTRRYGGTGLGLSISREIAQLLGGDITLTSEKGRGARFMVRLPAGNANPVDSSA